MDQMMGSLNDASQSNGMDQGEGYQGEGSVAWAKQELKDFWATLPEKVASMNASDFTQSQILPLARIKKIMKIEEDVKNMMISAEAPVVFAKAAEMFIHELTLQAWTYTAENKRRTLQKNDVSMAVAANEMFDFLIDIVPPEPKPTKKSFFNLPDVTDGTIMVQSNDSNGIAYINPSNLTNQAMVNGQVSHPQLFQFNGQSGLNIMPTGSVAPQLVGQPAFPGQIQAMDQQGNIILIDPTTGTAGLQANQSVSPLIQRQQIMPAPSTTANLE